MALCYNKGCGKTFELEKNNSADSCQHHPGVPVFHDAYKGWSCCTKKSTDFSEFLSFPGCTKSAHSNVKPVEVVREKSVEIEIPVAQSIEQHKTPELTARPTVDEPLAELKRTVAPSLLTALEKLNEKLKEIQIDENGVKAVPPGTPCKNATCKGEYKDEESNFQKCTFHPGIAIFHEGMKYWSCCERKTSDFDTFLNQVGCTIGSHLWFKEKSEQVECKHDLHQAANNFAILTVYSKNPVPDKTSIKANKIKLSIDISFDGGNKTFKKDLELFGVIKFDESKVEFYQSKVEIKLKKADPVSWARLEYTKKN